MGTIRFPRLRTLALAAALAAPVAGATACAGKSRGPMSGSAPTVVVFENLSIDQATVYAISTGSGNRVRLGTVMPNRTESLRVPSAALNGATTVNIVADLLANRRTPQTGQFSLQPGDRIRVTLQIDGASLNVLPAR